MAKLWFRSGIQGGYGPASREGWAVLVGYVFAATLIGVGLPLFAGGALWSWIVSPILVLAATFWLFRVVRARSDWRG